MKTIYLIRHGESTHNSQNNKLSGISDVKLSQKGINECKILKQFIKKFKIETVFTSPLGRAIESTKILFPKNKYNILNSLIELNYGDYEGYDQLGNKPDSVIRKWDATPGEMSFPKGDIVKEHAELAYKGLLEMIKSNSSDTIACISHKSTIRLILSKILKLNLNNFRRLPCDNCSMSVLEFSGDNLKINAVNIFL